MPLGAHLPTSKGFAAAVQQTRELGCDCLQIFSKSPRQWNAAPLKDDVVQAFRQAWSESGFGPLVAHDSYLINLAAPDATVLDKSLRAMQDEIERADILGCDFLVTHCGAHLQKNPSDAQIEVGLNRLADSLLQVFAATPDAKVKVALENTAAQGTCLGGPFEHLAHVLGRVNSDRLVVCFDTCHAFAAGHDLSSPAGVAQVVAEFDRVIGVERLAVIHLNDAKGELGGHLDRHAHIGEGSIGREAMRALLTHPKLRDRPFVLETPEIETHLALNLDTVRELQAGS